MDKKKLGVVIVVVVLASVFIGGATTNWFGFGSGQSTTTDGDTEQLTTLKTISNKDRADVSEKIVVTWWVVDPDSDFDETDDECLRPDTMTDYFEKLINEDEAADIEIDLSDYKYSWIEIDPSNSTPFAHNYHLVYNLNEGNDDLQVDVYHNPSNVYIENNLLSDGTRGVPDEDGTYKTSVIDFPLHPELDWGYKHVGDDWPISTADYNDLSEDLQLGYNDEGEYCSWSGTYNPTEDDDKDYDDELELYTTVPAIKIAMNETIGSGVTDVNCTTDTEDVEILIDGQYVYMAFIKNVMPGDEIVYEWETGANITSSTMTPGLLDVPDDDNSDLSFDPYAYALS